MLARTDALMSQTETGKIVPRPSSPLWPVVTRRVLSNCHGGHRANAQNSAVGIVKSANQAGFLPKGLTPSHDGRPSVSRR